MLGPSRAPRQGQSGAPVLADSPQSHLRVVPTHVGCGGWEIQGLECHSELIELDQCRPGRVVKLWDHKNNNKDTAWVRGRKIEAGKDLGYNGELERRRRLSSLLRAGPTHVCVVSSVPDLIRCRKQEARGQIRCEASLCNRGGGSCMVPANSLCRVQTGNETKRTTEKCMGLNPEGQAEVASRNVWPGAWAVA